jgi:hypothetical protein
VSDDVIVNFPYSVAGQEFLLLLAVNAGADTWQSLPAGFRNWSAAVAETGRGLITVGSPDIQIQHAVGILLLQETIK